MIAAATLGALLFASLAVHERSVASWSGMLLDAGCTDRSLDNLRARPMDEVAPTQNLKPPAGIRIAPQVVKAERAEATLPDTPDHASRYPSSSCALTGDTKAFMLLLPDGTLLDLDEGGNTLALDAFQATPAGRAILNGKVGGLKPAATIVGVRQGGQLRARSVELRPSYQATTAK